MKPLNEDQVMNSLNERDGVLMLIGTIKVAALAVLIFALASILLGALLNSCSKVTAQSRPERDAMFAAAAREAIFKTNKTFTPELSRLANTDQTTLITDKLQQDAVSEKKLSRNRLYQRTYGTKSKGKIKSPRR